MVHHYAYQVNVSSDNVVGLRYGTDSKLSAIRILRIVYPQLSLKDAKELIEQKITNCVNLHVDVVHEPLCCLCANKQATHTVVSSAIGKHYYCYDCVPTVYDYIIQ